VHRAERIAALSSFLKTLSSADVAPSSIGTVVIDDAVVKLIEDEVKRTAVSDTDCLVFLLLIINKQV